MCKHLIKVAMDDLRDAWMLMDYAKEARGTDWETFFANRMRQRMREFNEDRDWLHKAMMNDKDSLWHHMEKYLEDEAERLRWKMDGKA